MFDSWLEITFSEADIAETLLSSVVQLRAAWNEVIELKLKGGIVPILHFRDTCRVSNDAAFQVLLSDANLTSDQPNITIPSFYYYADLLKFLMPLHLYF